jgi:Chromo (CHRromatin Organisation MOdifier) domain
VNSDRIAPAPGRHASSNEAHSSPINGQKLSLSDNTPGEEPEYVIERIFGFRQLLEGSLRYKVRWFGYEEDDDTWEPEKHLPKGLVRKYHRNMGLPRGKHSLRCAQGNTSMSLIQTRSLPHMSIVLEYRVSARQQVATLFRFTRKLFARNETFIHRVQPA